MEEIALSHEKLRNLGVGVVYLFGSHAEGVAGSLSDIDIGVVFCDPRIAQGNTTELYGRLYDVFSEAFGSENLDIVFLERATLELRFDAISHGRTLYETSEDFRRDFEHCAVMLYADFKPLLRNFDRATLSRV